VLQMVKLERHSGCSLLMDTEVGSPFEMMKLLLAFKYFCGADINMSISSQSGCCSRTGWSVDMVEPPWQRIPELF
jgi:hypothetical protein